MTLHGRDRKTELKMLVVMFCFYLGTEGDKILLWDFFKLQWVILFPEI